VTVFKPDGTVTTTHPATDGTQVTEVTHPNGDTTVQEVQTVNDPTEQPVQIKTTTNTETNSQGQTTVIKIVDNPLNSTRTVTETVNNADGSQTVTTIVTDTSGQNVLSYNQQTIPSGSAAGPSTTAGSSKRPPPDDGPPDEGPPTKKSNKGKDPIR
jgi:hypothetical protein